MVVLCLCGLLVVGYSIAGTPVTLMVDGQRQQRHTHQTTVAGFLREAGISLFPEDRVSPSLDTVLASGSMVEVQYARQVIVEVDGNKVDLRSQNDIPAEILAEAGIVFKPSDKILVDGQSWELGTKLNHAEQTQDVLFSNPLSPNSAAPQVTRITVQRSVPVILTDGTLSVTFHTTQPTIGEALLEQDILLYLGDRVTPSLGTRVMPGVKVYIERSTPVTVHVDGKTLHTRTLRSNIGDLLAQEGILLMGRDHTLSPLNTPIVENMHVQVVRVKETIEIEQQTIPFETNWVPTPDMPIDSQQLVQSGEVGVTKKRTRTTYENGEAVASVLEDEWVDHEPAMKVIAYGTLVSTNVMDTSDGQIEYWRHFRALATAYSAATSGKSRDDPHYGITRTGMQAGYGVIAVDPTVIPLGSEVYVPGYGRAIAGDTGSSVLGKHVDLGFDEDQPPAMYRWVDVYLLTPIPPPDQIRFVLPNWPPER